MDAINTDEEQISNLNCRICQIHRIDWELAFFLWVAKCLQNHDLIVAAVKGQTSKVSHKYGIGVPTSVENVIDLDRVNKDTWWQDAISKEMRKEWVAFKILDDYQPTTIDWYQSSGHIVFDVKMDFI